MSQPASAPAPWGWLLPLFALSRLWVAAFVYLAHLQRALGGSVEGGWAGVAQWGLNPWTPYDSEWFIAIAQQGYNSALSSTFFPLYPLLLRLAGRDESRVALWGLLLSSAALLGALLALYQLTRALFGERAARAATFLLAFFPTSAYFSAVYTESLFLCCLLWAFYAAQQRRWLRAGLLAALASLTRNSGPIIAVALLMEYGRLAGWRQARGRDVAALLLPLLLFALVQGLFALRFHDALASVANQSAYNRALMWPWQPVWWDLQATLRLADLDSRSPFTLLLSGVVFLTTRLLNLSVTLLAFLLLFLFRSRVPPGYIVLTLATLLLHLIYGRTLPPHTLSAARYLSTTFPFVQAAALAVEGIMESRGRRLLPLALAAYLLLTGLTSYLFGMKIFMG